MSNANTFFNFMQAWNSEIQTSQLRKLNDSLASNVSSLSNLKSSGGEVENRAAALKLSKDALFSARKMIEEIEENLEKEPEVSLFIYIKVIDGMSDIKDTDFDEFSDKEYFLASKKKFYTCGERLKQKYGPGYIQDLKIYKKLWWLHHYLHYLGFCKDLNDYFKGNSYRSFFGINMKKLREDVEIISNKWSTHEVGQVAIKRVWDKGVKNSLEWNGRGLGSFANKVCELDVYEWGNLDFWTAVSVDEISNYVEELEHVGAIVIETTTEILGDDVLKPLGGGLNR